MQVQVRLLLALFFSAPFRSAPSAAPGGAAALDP